MRCAVVGHVEWVEFARVPGMPAAGSIVHASETWSEPAGGGAVVARQLALLAGRCELFTALGSDELGRASQRRLAGLGIDVHVQWGGETRRAWTHIDGAGERTITVLGDKLLPHGPLPLGGYDLLFFVSGNPEVLRAARSAGFLAATVRELPTLREAGVPLDLVVGSLNDAGERYDGSLEAETVVLDRRGERRHRERRGLTPRCRPRRSWTPTAPAIRSRRRSPSRLPEATISERQSPSRPGPVRP